MIGELPDNFLFEYKIRDIKLAQQPLMEDLQVLSTNRVIGEYKYFTQRNKILIFEVIKKPLILLCQKPSGVI